MAVLAYGKMMKGLPRVNSKTRTFQFNGNDVEVLEYLPIEDKYELIQLTLQRAKQDNGLYDPFILDWVFHLNLVYSYCLIKFTDKQREDEEALYDALESNGFIQAFLDDFNELEYNQLQEDIQEIIDKEEKYNMSASNIVKELVIDGPKATQKAVEVINNFDENQLENLKQVASDFKGGATNLKLLN